MKKAEKKINVAIDGPSGAGKSTLAKALAKKLGINYVDTGAIYRTVGYAAFEAGIDPSDREAVTKMLEGITVEVKFEDSVQQMYLNGRPLGDLIRRHEISDYASRVSAIPEVRAFLLETQRETARNGGTIMDGRDIGTVILPDADVKIFLSASVEKRAERRYKELIERGDSRPYEEVLADIRERDERDSSRDTAPLRPADDAVFLDNSEIGLEESVDAALEIIRSKTGRRAKRCSRK